jgi:hypothetical protein
VVALSALDHPAPVFQALAEYDELGEDAFLTKYGFDRSRTYWLLHNGKRYASKAIFGAAFGYLAPGAQPLKASEFAGGKGTVEKGLRRLGFTFEKDDASHLATEPSILSANEANENAFNPEGIVDARKEVLGVIKARRGQKAFRDGLLKAYGGRCAISGCAVIDVLEAAHIVPYRGDNTNHPTNGLLLRADLHTLFDCRLLTVDPGTLMILVASTIKDLSYREFHGLTLRPTTDARLAPSLAALSYHRKAAAF